MDHRDDPRLVRVTSLHDRLLAGDRRGLEEAFELFDRDLVRRLSSRPRFRGVDPQVIEDGVFDAIFEYVQKPGAFDPSSGRTPDRHVEMAAERNVSNARRGDTRRRRREREAAARRAECEGPVELHSPAGIALTKEDEERRVREHQRLLALLPDPADRRVLALRMSGERKTASFAEALGVGHLPVERQRREVKRAKDRIDKALRCLSVLTRRPAAGAPRPVRMRSGGRVGRGSHGGSRGIGPRVRRKTFDRPACA